MPRPILALLATAAIALAGCNVMEQYHYAPAVNEVPTPVKIAFSEKYPNEVIQWPQTYAQKMYDGSMHYRVVALDAKSASHEHVFNADGTEVK